MSSTKLNPTTDDLTPNWVDRFRHALNSSAWAALKRPIEVRYLRDHQISTAPREYAEARYWLMAIIQDGRLLTVFGNVDSRRTKATKRIQAAWTLVKAADGPIARAEAHSRFRKLVRQEQAKFKEYVSQFQEQEG